jgi:hypothetical protein
MIKFTGTIKFDLSSAKPSINSIKVLKRKKERKKDNLISHTLVTNSLYSLCRPFIQGDPGKASASLERPLG